MKKIIISNSQLKKVLAEENTTNVQVNTTGNSIPSLTNAVMQNQPKITNAAKTGDVSLHLSNPSAQAGSNDNIVTQHVEVGQGENISNAITKQVNPTALSQGGDVEVSGPGISERKVFTKRMVEEARLKKMREDGVVLTKRALKESFLNHSDVNQWKEELKMFMNGLRKGDYVVDGNTLYVEIFKGQTPENDPRYVYIRKGENRLHDDHFCIQNSPTLKDLQLKDIYYNAGWEDVLPELIDYNKFEMYENKIEIKPENKGKFTATKKRTGKSTEELTHSKNPVTKKRAIFARNAKKWNKSK